MQKDKQQALTPDQEKRVDELWKEFKEDVRSLGEKWVAKADEPDFIYLPGVATLTALWASIHANDAKTLRQLDEDVTRRGALGVLRKILSNVH